jgi:resuscitation-promoting factor RpfB
MSVSGLSVAYVTFGLVLVWAGYKNATLADTLKGFVSGQVPAGTPTGSPSVGLDDNSSSSDSSLASQILGSGAAGGNVSANQAIAKMLAASYGWATGQNWTDLVQLWDRESSWSNTAQNPGSGAYGIPQALPYSKMPKSAWPPADGGSSNATAQISWGLNYIKETYGSPTSAWAHEESQGWY